MRHITSPDALAAQMAEATDEQLRLVLDYGKPYAQRAAQYEALRRSTTRERFRAAERARPAVRTFHSDALGAVTIPEDDKPYSGTAPIERGPFPGMIWP